MYMIDSLDNDTQKSCKEVTDFTIVLYNVMCFSYSRLSHIPIACSHVFCKNIVVIYMIDSLDNDTQKLCIEVRDFIIVLYITCILVIVLISHF